MFNLRTSRPLLGLVTVITAAGCGPQSQPGSGSGRYQDLVALFEEWRAFQRPPLVEGVPDYSPQAMEAQRQALPDFQGRLAAFDTTNWPVARQVDYHLVRAEMNGLDFDHRVRRPWARNPAFYRTIFTYESDVPTHVRPVAYGEIELWTYEFPLTAEASQKLAGELGIIPGLLQQAEGNLTGNARDLWVLGVGTIREQRDNLAMLMERVPESNGDLREGIRRALDATETFRVWLEGEAPSKTGPSGIGTENYDWYLKNVHLVPFTWQDEVAIMRRELARAHSSLRLEENRNRKRQPLRRIASAREYDRRFDAAVTEYMTFFREQEIVPLRDYMDRALRERIGRFQPAEGLRGFFSEVSYRDEVVMRTHDYHWIDLARMAHEPHDSPIRRVPLLYSIFDNRAEGFATGMEEMMMHAGLFDDRPLTRELIWILLAQRAARALGDLMMHANRYTFDDAVRFASKWTPRGWLPEDGSTVRGEQQLYLEQPSYGTSYVIGKIEAEQLIADRALQLGDEFTLKRFMDEFNGAGMIPVSLIRWELTGETDQIAWLTTAR